MMNYYYSAEGQRALELASIEVQKKTDEALIMANIEVGKQRQLEGIRLDRQLKKESMVRVLEQSDDGFWLVNTKRFDDAQYHCRFSDLRSVAAGWLRRLDKEEEPVLFIEFSVGNEAIRKQCFFKEGEVTAKQVQKKMIRTGVHFFVKEGIKKELLDALIASIVQMAKTIEVPGKHGWYYAENRWCYAGKKNITWREVEKRAK